MSSVHVAGGGSAQPRAADGRAERRQADLVGRQARLSQVQHAARCMVKETKDQENKDGSKAWNAELALLNDA